MARYCANLGAQPTVLVPESAQIFVDPKVIVGDPNLVIGSRPKEASHPAVSLRRINNVCISAASNLISVGRFTLLDDIVKLESDKLADEYRVGVKVNVDARLIFQPYLASRKHVLSEAISLLDATAPNYAHWLTEILPKAALFRDYFGEKTPSVLVDVGLHPNIMRSLDLVVSSKQRVIQVPRGHTVAVGRLHHVSSPGYIPFEPRGVNALQRSHGTFSGYAIDLMVKKIKDSLGLNDKDPQNEVVFIRRNSGARNLLNGPELEEFVARQGWTVVEPERLSFDEQVRIFHGAKMVVGATGAAMVNMLFCRPGTRVAVMMSNHPATPYCYWHNMAAPRGVRVEYIIGEAEEGAPNGVHSNFSVSIVEIDRFFSRQDQV